MIAIISTPLVVEVKDRLHPKFKWHPYKFVDIEPLGGFSSVSYKVLHVEDIRAYVHANIEDLGTSHLLDLYTHHITKEDLKL